MWAAVGWAIVRFVVVFAVSYLVNQAFAPRPKGSNAGVEAVSEHEWNFPQAEEGTPQCVFFGDCWSEDWQVLAYGNYRTSEIKKGYPPGNVKVNNVLGTTLPNTTNFTLTWAHRDRVIQADNLIAHTDDSTVLGAGVQYQITLFNGATRVRQIMTTETQFTYPDAAKPEAERIDAVTLYAVDASGLTSRQGYRFANLFA